MAACGDGSDPKPARVGVTAPADSTVVHADSVEVRGRVQPAGARVLVLGRPATVTGARFSARVPLREGPNVIDVGASTRGRAPAWTAVRVSRVVVVKLPDLGGVSRGDAVDRLHSLGLTADVHEDHGLLDTLLPGDRGVCEMRPQAGVEVSKGTRVRLTVSKTC
jgi:hypothetical protein